MLIIGNGRMITRDASKAFIENGAVAMDGNTIVMVGTTDEVKKAYPDGEFVDARGGVIMPAFINTHEHIYSSFARGLSIKGYNPKGFLDILDGQWWTIDRHLTLEQTRLSAMATYIDSIRNGVTTVFDHHASFGHITGSLSAIESAAKDLGVRTCLCYEISVQFLIIFIFKFSKITFCKLINNIQLFSGKKDSCSLGTADHRTCINCLYLRISKLRQHIPSLRTKRFIRSFSYISF